MSKLVVMQKYTTTKTPFETLLSFASSLKKMRKQLHFSQKELARRSGVSLGSLKRFEQTGQISLSSFLKLLHVLSSLDKFANLFAPENDLSKIEALFSDKTRK